LDRADRRAVVHAAARVIPPWATVYQHTERCIRAGVFEALVIVFLVLQRYIVQGVRMSGIKG
jgi:ABC-type glycerol-3-phosphate transport system permease component